MGKSPIGGPCDGETYGNATLNAAVAGLSGGEKTARTFAHEIGHYLGLWHENDLPRNLMCMSSLALDVRISVQLSESQGKTIRRHCLIRSGCLVLPQV